MLYLDTHVVVWMFQNDKARFSENAIELIDRNKKDLYISPIVILEVEYLFEIDRVKHHGKEMIDYLINRVNLNICKHPFSDVVNRSLTIKWTRDPFDRIVTSYADLNKAKLLTKDKLIRQNFDAAVW